MNETFVIGLSNPSDGAMLGPQSKTIVTIIDDDYESTVPPQTTATGAGINYDPVAYVNNYVEVTPRNYLGEKREGIDDRDMFWYEIWDTDREIDNTGPNGHNPQAQKGHMLCQGKGEPLDS